MKDLIWEIAKSGEEVLENTELQAIEDAFMTGKSQVEVLAGVSAGTAAIVDGLAKVETDKAAHIAALGF